jgi:hypothetical protein
MKSSFAAVMFGASLLATGCSGGTTTSGLRNDFVPVGTTGTIAPAAARSEPITPTPAPTTVNCGANRQAVVRQVQLDGKTVEQVDCVTATAASSTPTAGRAVTPQRVNSEGPRRNKRSWKKSALVIGGSSAAGAGIGALIGGKKGALIGAAAGGGAGTVYEVKKRK